MRRVEQITSSHCGPATLVMLLSYLGVDISQESIVEISGAGHKISDYGILVSEMAEATKKLTPQFQFWYKERGSLDDLTQIVERFKYPVGIEWQGVFFEDSDEDDGHYSVITHVDSQSGTILISDPYKRFAGQDRIFHVEEFLSRWWEENEVFDPFTGRRDVVHDERMMFIVTGKEVSFPEDFGMTRG